MKRCPVCKRRHEKQGIEYCFAAEVAANKEMELLLQKILLAQHATYMTAKMAMECNAASGYLHKRKEDMR